MSRRVFAALFASVDGVVEAPNTFQFDSFDERMGELMGESLAPIDDVVMGRVTYSEWSGYWPGAEDPFANFINPVRKHVASRTLSGDLDWNNSSLIEGDVVDYVKQLKESEGGDISVTGSISLVRQLFLAGVLDELMLMIHPVIAGNGRTLFEPGDGPTRLELVKSESTPAGNAIMTYRLKA